ncbi:MAG: glutamate--tRNA ligase [Mycoplasmataceae bacterium]|nr:glutamate--tRNA ligase [Mycoplasmataceae bacterium]
MKVRTRYAPSPTGFFHIGGARTALFNYLYAKHHQGTFICRIEDTDVERNVEGGVDSQLNNLDWLKITPDESPRTPGNYPPYIQTQKLKRYQGLAHKLLEEGKAYYCFCSKKELQQQREEALKQGLTPKYNRRCLNLTKTEIADNLKKGLPAVIRLKMKDNAEIKWHDLIRGPMTVPTSALTDPVILKSNGIPMYNFAVVIDDYDMAITHVLRGEEHISNTPYQIAIKEALNFDKQPIEYGHLSIIIDETGKKLSKRNQDLKQFIEDYKQMGFLPEAVTNFLSLLGWSDKNNRELLSMSEIIDAFDIDRVSKAPAFFDFKKMLWISNQYVKKLNDKEYLNFIKPFLTIKSNDFRNDDAFVMALLLFKPQLSYASEINTLVTKMFLEVHLNQLPKELNNLTKTINFNACIKTLKEVINSYQEITLENGNEIVNKVKDLSGLKGKDLYLPIRLVAIAKEHGPEMNKILYIVGKEQLLKNIDSIGE